MQLKPKEKAEHARIKFSSARAKNLREDEELISAGFEYVTEREDVKVYRKRK
jgi:hypothetical protein